ncbi:MAG: glycosyltransferase family 2 protein [Calothrix sp. C42_A2020_038]|nr:glycosyltransferase family 2 protein [Calothrix sp. C42_A2020_038]
MSTLITIAIPTYNRLNYLKEAVASALAQTYPHIEVIIGQDPTPNGLDQSIQVWSQMCVSQNSKVRYQFNSHNLGLAGNWNALADAAKGEYLIIIGDDDRLLPNFVETLMSVANSDTLVIFSNHYIINSQGKRLEQKSYEWTERYHRDLIPNGKVIEPEKWVWQNSIPMSASLIRTKDVQRLRFKEDLNTPEIEFFIRLSFEEGDFLFVPQYLSEYRIHEQSATTLGLRTESLVNYLLPISVKSKVEPYKQELLSQLMVNAVSRSLLKNQHKQARDLFCSEYYPEYQRKRVNGLVQNFCTLLPKVIGCQIYRLIHRLKTAL